MGERSRLLVVHTGGTIGMVPTEQGWAPGADVQGWLDGLVAKHFTGLAVDFVALEPLVDSSSATPADWQRIIDVVEQRAGSFDAVLVLHGTDTMAYTAAALAWAFAGRRLSVVLTGSQRSLVVADSDAPHNVRAAIGCALDERLDQVALCFDDLLLPGHRATKASSVMDSAFHGVNSVPVATIEPDDGSITFFGLDTRAPELPEAVTQPFRGVDLAIVTMHPGLTAARLRAQLTPAPAAAVLRAYGTGNVPDNDPELAAALAEAADAGTILVVTTQCPDGGVLLGHYAASQPLLRADVLSGGTLGVESLVALLTLAVCQGWTKEQVREVLHREEQHLY